MDASHHVFYLLWAFAGGVLVTLGLTGRLDGIGRWFGE